VTDDRALDPPPLPEGEDSPEGRRRRYVQYAGLWTLGLVVPAVYLGFAGLYNPGMQVSNAAPTILGIWAIFYPLYIYRLHLVRLPSFALMVAVTSIVVAVVSIATGWGNGLTDEPYAMPVFITTILNHQDPYSTGITVTYNQYGTIFHLGPVTYIYLPFLIFFQPFIGGGTGYKVFTVVLWAGMVYLVRKDAFAVVAIAQPYMALLAASGFNDFPALFLLTLAFVGVNGKRQKWAEYLALGCKQFANVFVVAYYAIQRDWKNLLIAVVVSIAWVLPFIIWDASAFICQAVLFSPSGCSSTSAGGFLYHLNYWAWPVWVLAVYFGALRRYYHRFMARVRKQPRPAGERAAAPPPASSDPGVEGPPAPSEATEGPPPGRRPRPGDSAGAPSGSSG